MSNMVPASLRALAGRENHKITRGNARMLLLAAELLDARDAEVRELHVAVGADEQVVLGQVVVRKPRPAARVRAGFRACFGGRDDVARVNPGGR